MRIYLQMPASGEQLPRYYQVLLQEDLLGGWTLITESGRLDAGGGRIRREYFTTHEAAERALFKVRDSQLARGYRVVFVEGDRITRGR
jgi:predicted DNA-binding WGR domain protein